MGRRVEGCRRRIRVGRWGLAAIAGLSSLLFGSMASALDPPKPFVMAPDGTTQLTLEQAGILNPDGKRWAIALGKALFWDRQAGSDGQACASCHFSAGADTRLRNQLTPGFNDITKGLGGDQLFGSERSDTGAVALGYMPSGALAGANYVLTPGDMPLHQLADERDRNSPVRSTTNDRVSSQGSFSGTFTGLKILGAPDTCDGTDSPFHVGPYAARQVEPRNSPTTINAAFFHRNFWDDRANNLFNGVGVFGMRDILGDPNKRLVVLNGTVPQLGYLKVENASLASQAVGPPLSITEMSCDSRKFADVATRLLLSRPLIDQRVSTGDSVLGPYANPYGPGLGVQYSYLYLIQKAFDRKYWAASGRFKIVDGQLVKGTTGYKQAEINFPMFWGLAIMLYEQTLVSDQSEVDTLLASGDLVMRPSFAPGGPAIGGCSSPSGNVDPLLLRGCTIFARFAPGGGAAPPPPDGIRGGSCFVCHNAPGGGVGKPIPPLLSQAAFESGEQFALMIQVGKNLGGVHRHDQGTMSIGLRPVFTDLINGGTDPYGNPLSFTRQYHNYLVNGTPPIDPELQRAIDQGTIGPFAGTVQTLGVDGAAKSPILRNVALTPPYFSWGGYPDLRQAMKLYNRGFNRRDITAANAATENAVGTACTTGDNTGTGPDGNQPYPLTGVTNCDTNTTGIILPLGLLDCDPEAATGQPPAQCAATGRNSSNDDLAALVRFMKGLTDPRVQCDAAPFDHPELTVFDGHTATDANGDGKADDITAILPAVGAAGYARNSGYCIPNSGDLFAPGMQARSGGLRVNIP